MHDTLLQAMETAKCMAMTHILPCEACAMALDMDGLFCPEGERLKTLADAAIKAYVWRHVPQAGKGTRDV